MITEELKKLYIAHTGHEPEQIDELPSSGSNRRYFRLIGSPTLIGVSGESVEENRAFLYMAEHFRQKGLPVPQVFIRSEDDIYYLQEDLGDSLLFNAIEKGRKTSVFGEEEKQLLRKTIRLLPAVQFAGADGMDFSYCYPQAEFNSRSILWDLNYFNTASSRLREWTSRKTGWRMTSRRWQTCCSVAAPPPSCTATSRAVTS